MYMTVWSQLINSDRYVDIKQNKKKKIPVRKYFVYVLDWCVSEILELLVQQTPKDNNNRQKNTCYTYGLDTSLTIWLIQ